MTGGPGTPLVTIRFEMTDPAGAYEATDRHWYFVPSVGDGVVLYLPDDKVMSGTVNWVKWTDDLVVVTLR